MYDRLITTNRIELLLSTAELDDNFNQQAHSKFYFIPCKFNATNVFVIFQQAQSTQCNSSDTPMEHILLVFPSIDPVHIFAYRLWYLFHQLFRAQAKFQ